MQQRRIQGTQGRKGWQRFLLPLIIIAAGTALALVSTLLGGVVILVGYVWPAFQSLSGGLALYVIFAPFQIGLTVHHHHIDVSDLMAIVMGIKLLAISVRDGTESLWQRFMGSPFWRPLLLVLVLSVLSLATALSHTTTVVKILEYLEFFVVVTAVVRHADLREEQWKPAIHALFAVASVLSLYGLYQFMFQVGPHANVIDRYHIRADAVFGQPNAFGGFESMVFPLMLAFIAYGPDWGKRWWSWVGLSLSALGVIDSFSRGAWVASAGAVFFMGVVAWAARGRTMINRRFVFPGIMIPILAFLVIDLLGKTNLSHSAFVLSKSTGGES